MTYQNEIQKGFLSAVSTTIDYSLQTASRVLHELLVWTTFELLNAYCNIRGYSMTFLQNWSNFDDSFGA